MEDNLLNGRVDILSSQNPSFVPTRNNPATYASTAPQQPCNIMSTTTEHTPVSSLFFSQKNIDALQLGICNQVYNRSNGKYNVGKQSEIELKIIMRSIYFDSLRNAPVFAMQQVTSLFEPQQPSTNMVLQEVRNLNQKVLKWSVDRILVNIQQFDKYKQDVSKLPDPMSLPTSMSSAGKKTLEFQSFF